MFGRKKAIDILRQGAWRCRSCNEEHHGIFDLVAYAPYHWGEPAEAEPNSALRMDGDFLSEDFCVMGARDFFVRGFLNIPVIGMGSTFAYGCWSSLSRSNFERYVENFDGLEVDEPWTGWFACTFAAFPDTLNAPCWIMPLPDRSRPDIWLENDDHPLSIAQRDGISADRLLEIYRQHGHDIG